MAEQKDKSQGELTEDPMERNEMDFNENAAENGNELDRNTQLKTCTDSSNDSNAPTFSQIKKRSTKGIFISYGNNAGFLERQFVCETVRQLKEINLSEDIWFDKDEVDISSCMWFPQRIEALEKCKAVILFLSQSYFQNKVSLLESKILLKRLQSTERRVHVFPILYNRVEIPKSYSQLLDGALDLSGAQVAKTSVSEKSSIVIGSLSEKIDRYVIKAPVSLVTNQLSERLGKFKGKRLATWSVEDTQEWLLHAGIKEFYRQSFAELMMDGFLMSSLTDEDLSQFLGVDSRGTRRTILHQIVILQEREKKLPDSWHLQAKSARPRTGTVYLIYDPADTNFAKTLSTELQKNKLLVVYSEYLGQSKEGFLRENGPHMSLATKVVLVLTEAAAGSPIVYLQVLFSEWLGKAMMTAVFRNSWDRLRPSLKVILGDKSAVDFERQLFQDALPILQDLLQPRRMMPGVILEQAYIDRIAEGVKPLQNLASSSADVVYWPIDNEEIQPKIFISYQWDVQTKVQEIRTFLELNSLWCWADLCVRGHSSMSTRSVAADPTTETLQNKIHRHMKAAAVVLSCFTPKYIHSDNCNKDLQLAMSQHKPLVPVLLHFMPWPPEGTTSSIRRFLCQFATIDLSNDKLFKRNLHLLLNRIKKSLKIKEL